jgi:hypothetical protein
MSLLGRFLDMLGFSGKPKPNYVGPEISRAVQRNDMASDKARRVLEDIKRNGGMSDTIKDIAGKMK